MSRQEQLQTFKITVPAVAHDCDLRGLPLAVRTGLSGVSSHANEPLGLSASSSSLMPNVTWVASNYIVLTHITLLERLAGYAYHPAFQIAFNILVILVACIATCTMVAGQPLHQLRQ